MVFLQDSDSILILLFRQALKRLARRSSRIRRPVTLPQIRRLSLCLDSSHGVGEGSGESWTSLGR